MQDLSLTCCLLSGLPPGMLSSMSNLERLNLADNEMWSLPEGICSLSKLKVSAAATRRRGDGGAQDKSGERGGETSD